MLDFPASPTTGQVYLNWQFDGVKWISAATGGSAKVMISDIAPASPKAGDIWFDSVGAQSYLWYTDPTSNQWTPLNSLTGGPYLTTAQASSTYLPVAGGTVTGPVSFASSASFNGTTSFTTANATFGGTSNFTGTTNLAATNAPTAALPDVSTTVATTAFAHSIVDPYMFGTGLDGDATITTTVGPTRDMHYRNLTISGAGALTFNGYRLFVSGTLNLANAGVGAIRRTQNNGVNATTATGATANGTISSAATCGGGSIAGNGGTGNTTTGTNPTAGTGYNGNFGGTGGTAGVGGASTSAGGTGLGGGTTGIARTLIMTPTITPTISANNSATYFLLSGGTGGGGGGQGGGDGTSAGGGGGSGGNGGGSLGIYARIIDRGNNSTVGIIQALGGNAGNGANAVGGNAGGGAGGGGGGGGYVYIVCQQLLGNTIVNAIDVSSGTGGAGGNGLGTGKGGNGGAGGGGGAVQIIVLSPMSATSTAFNTAGGAGNTTSTATGATGGTAAIVQMNL